MANKGGGGGGNCDKMTKIWHPVLPGQPRSNVGWDFPAKKQGCVGRGVTIPVPFDSIRFRLLPFGFDYFDSIMQNINDF